MTLDGAPLARVRLALREAVRDYLLVEKDVVAVDFGLPERGGVIEKDELALRVHVRKKKPVSVLEAEGVEPVPARMGEFQTDVLEGTYRPELWWGPTISRPPGHPRLGRVDPLRGGISLSDERHYSAGTLGAKVVDRSTGAEMILSNWHVLAADWTAQPGQRIYQPGRLDGGTLADTVATLTRDAMSSGLDAAVARLNGSRRLVSDQLGIGPITGTEQAALGMEVAKSGRTTGVTYGRITGVEGTAQIAYAGVRRLIRKVITVSPLLDREVSRPGDSGSMWIAGEGKQAVGLHFAGSDVPERALAMDIQTVLLALNVDLEAGGVAIADRRWSMADLLLSDTQRRVAVHA